MSVSVHPTVCSKETFFAALPFFAPLPALKHPHYLYVIKPAEHVPTTFFVTLSTSCFRCCCCLFSSLYSGYSCTHVIDRKYATMKKWLNDVLTMATCLTFDHKHRNLLWPLESTAPPTRSRQERMRTAESSSTPRRGSHKPCHTLLRLFFVNRCDQMT